MEIKTKKSYDIRITHEERRVMMNALAYSIDHGMDNTQCSKLFDEFMEHSRED